MAGAGKLCQTALGLARFSFRAPDGVLDSIGVREAGTWTPGRVDLLDAADTLPG